MQSLDVSVITHALRWHETQPVWLCTVLNTFGSSPRPPGAMMVINQAGQYCGSLSGGCIEEDFILRIKQGEFRQASQIVRYGDGGLTPVRQLPCGGVLDILIEYLPMGLDNRGRLELLHQALTGRRALRKTIIPPHACDSIEETDWRSSTVVERSGEQVILTIAAPPRLIIAGLSEVAVFCAEFSLVLGFETLVCENRDEVIDNFAHRLNPQVVLARIFPARYLETQGCHANTAVVALTHDPRLDDLTMMEAVLTEAFYVGVMGSARNSRNRLERLKNIGGLSAQQLARIHAPVGMRIGSKTPAEIALSVMVDIVKLKNQAG